MLSLNSTRFRGLTLGPALIASAFLFQWPQACGQNTASDAKQERGKWVPLFERHAGEYVIRVGHQHQAERLSEPVLRWWQPVRGGDDGALYIWVHEGRPVAALTFFTFKWPNGTRCIVHEKASLALEPLEATWRGNMVWHTSRPGLTFKRIQGAPAPAGSAPARLRQMVALVREFSANTVDDKASKWQLRPLVQPLYRYEGKNDGALFALVQGTDPEAFILLEERSDGNESHWEYANARFTDLEIHIRYKGREVFLGQKTSGEANEIYHSPTVLSKPSDSPEDFR